MYDHETPLQPQRTVGSEVAGMDSQNVEKASYKERENKWSETYNELQEPASSS